MFTATFSRPDENAKWAFKGEEIFHGKQYKIELLEDETKDKTIHQLTIKKPMFKNQGKYTVTCNEVQTGAYLDVEGKINSPVTYNNCPILSSFYTFQHQTQKGCFYAFSLVILHYYYYYLNLPASLLKSQPIFYPERDRNEKAMS